MISAALSEEENPLIPLKTRLPIVPALLALVVAVFLSDSVREILLPRELLAQEEESKYEAVEKSLQAAVKAKTLDQIRHWTDVLVATQDPKAIDLLIRVGLMSNDRQVEEEIVFRLVQGADRQGSRLPLQIVHHPSPQPGSESTHHFDGDA